ncbi:hypothetical protein D3C87_1032760 [compost metagenome]
MTSKSNFLLISAVLFVAVLAPLQASAQLTTVDDGANGWTWRNFGSYVDDAAYKGKAHGTHNKGAYGQYSFTGTTVEVYGRSGPIGGSIEVIIDGISRGSYSQLGSVEVYNSRLFNVSNLSNTRHTIRLVTKNTGWAMLDYLKVGTLTAPTPTPSPSPSPTVPPVDPTRYTDERELVVRTIANFANHNDVVRFMDLAKKYSYTMISFAVKQDEDDEVISGTVFYPSKIAPVAPIYKNFDVVADIIAEGRKRGLKMKAWIPQFHDQVATKKGDAWAMKALVNGKIINYTGSGTTTEYFANPLNPDVQNYQISIVKEFLSMYQVDAVAVDWLRFDDYHMDLGPATRADYQAAYGYDPITIDFSRNTSQRTQWNDYRSTKLAGYFAKLRSAVDSVRPGMVLGAYTLPPDFIEVGQNAKKLAPYLDFFSPMAYYDDWGYNINWVTDTVMTLLVGAVGPDKAILPAYNYYWTQSQFKTIYTSLASKYPKIRGASFFKYGYWEEADMKNADTGSKK